MDELQVLSVTTEIALWELFQSGRTANLTFGIGMVIAVWVAARFSSVAMEKGVNMFGKVILTLFAASVLFGGLNLMMTTDAVWIAHANALAGLDAGNGAATLSEGSMRYIAENSESNPIRMIAGGIFYLCGFLIAIAPIWFDPTK